jgi:hypothetical protein
MNTPGPDTNTLHPAARFFSLPIFLRGTVAAAVGAGLLAYPKFWIAAGLALGLIWLSKGILLLTVALHVAFPKAGIKLGSVPVTAADATFALLLAASLWFYLSGTAKKLLPAERRCATYLGLAILFFTVRIGINLASRGVIPDDAGTIAAMCIYPLVFFVILKSGEVQAGVLYRVITFSVVIVLCYGFVQKVIGDASVIPGLTANWDDAQLPGFLLDKNNLLNEYGDIKLTSTYQNGNLLGINLLLLLPLGVALQRRWLKIGLVAAASLALALTASRAAWVGYSVLAFAAIFLFVRGWFKRIAIIAVLLAAAWGFVLFSSLGTERITESDNVLQLAGRLIPAQQLVQEASGANVARLAFGLHSEMVDAYEMFYLAVFEVFGFAGLALWAAPVCFSVCRFWRYRSDPICGAILAGIGAWTVAAIAEGAFWLPPTAFNFWLVIAAGWLRIRALESNSETQVLPRNLSALSLRIKDA